MNKQRRTEIQKIHDRLEDIKGELQAIIDDEQEYNDNIPDNLRDGQRCTDSDDALSELDNAFSEIESSQSSLMEAAK